jgi:hypothetical protein
MGTEQKLENTPFAVMVMRLGALVLASLVLHRQGMLREPPYKPSLIARRPSMLRKMPLCHLQDAEEWMTRPEEKQKVRMKTKEGKRVVKGTELFVPTNMKLQSSLDLSVAVGKRIPVDRNLHLKWTPKAGVRRGKRVRERIWMSLFRVDPTLRRKRISRFQRHGCQNRYSLKSCRNVKV